MRKHGNCQVQLTIANKSGFTQQVDAGTLLGKAVDIQEVAPQEEAEMSVPGDVDLLPDFEPCNVLRVEATDEERKRKLLQSVDVSGSLNPEQAENLQNFLSEHPSLHSIKPG